MQQDKSSFEKLNQWRQVSFDTNKIHGLDFTANDENVIFSSNRNGAFHLWQTSIDDWMPKLISEAIPNVGNLSIDSRNNIALESWKETSQVLKVKLKNLKQSDLKLAEEKKIIIDDKGMNWNAQKSPIDDSIIFVSNRTGSSELWLENGDEYQQLTNFGGPWVMAPSWSNDGKMVAFMVSGDSDYSTWIYNVQEQRLWTHKELKSATAPIWDPKINKLYFGSNRNGDWQIWSWNFNDEKLKQITVDGAKIAKIRSDGQMFYSRNNKPGIWKFNANSKDEIVNADLLLVDWNNWQLDKDNIIYVKRNKTGQTTLIRQNLRTNTTEKLNEIEGLVYFSGLFLDAEHFWYSKRTSEDVDIELLLVDSHE